MVQLFVVIVDVFVLESLTVVINMAITTACKHKHRDIRTRELAFAQINF